MRLGVVGLVRYLCWRSNDYVMDTVKLVDAKQNILNFLPG